MSSELTHIDKEGNSKMVDVAQKKATERKAIAEGWVLLSDSTLELITMRRLNKGDVLQIAQLAGIMATKRTADIIPLCHPIPIDAVSVLLTPHPEKGIHITAEVSNVWKTGVEMEALMAVSGAALTIYDMVKAVERHAVITNIQLIYKNGGRTGKWERS